MTENKWKKIGIITAVAIGVLIIGAVILVPKLLDINQYRNLIIAHVEEAIGGKVQIGRMSWHIADNIVLQVHEVSIRNPAVFPFDIDLPLIYAEGSIVALLRKKISIEELIFVNPNAELKLGSGAVDASEDKKSRKKDALSFEIEIDRFVIQQGRISLEDAFIQSGSKPVSAITDVNIALSNIRPNEEIGFDFSFRNSMQQRKGIITGKGSFLGLTETFSIEKPMLKLRAAVDSLDVDTIKSYLPNQPVFQRIDGHVSMEIDYSGDIDNNSHLGGSIDLSKTGYKDPALSEKPLPGMNSKIAFQVSLKQERMNIENLKIDVGDIAFDASGLVEGWMTAPIIKNMAFTSQLPLKAIASLIPWSSSSEVGGTVFIRQILERGGKLFIENGMLPDFDLKDPPQSIVSYLNNSRLTARLTDLSIPPYESWPGFHAVSGILSFADGSIEVKKLNARMASIQLPEIDGHISDVFSRPTIVANFKGPLRVPESDQTANFRWFNDLGIEKISGTAEVDVRLKIDTKAPNSYQLSGKTALNDMSFKTALSQASVEGLSAEITINPDTIEILNGISTVILADTEKKAGHGTKIGLEGRIDHWRDNPLYTLRQFKTSAIPLPALVAIIPWKPTGSIIENIKESFSTGGQISVDSLSFSNLDPKSLAVANQTLFPTLKANLSFSDLNLQVDESFPNFETLSGRLNLEKEVLKVNGLKGRFEHLTLPVIDVEITNIFDEPRVWMKATGPMQLESGKQARIRKLLMENGLNRFSGVVDVDLSVRYDHAKPKEWGSSGFIDLKGIHTETYPAGVRLENLNGRISLQRNKTMDLQIRGLTARVEGAPIRIDGRVTGGGTSRMIIDTEVLTSKIDLSHIADLIPPLEKMNLKGMLDMDMDIFYPIADLKKTRLQGKASVRGLGVQLEKAGLDITEGDGELQLSEKSLVVKSLAVRANDQPLTVNGQLTIQQIPTLKLQVKSPRLNIDRLLGIRDGRPFPALDADRKRNTKQAELPNSIKNSALSLDLQAGQVLYKGQTYEDLRLFTDYQEGVIKNCHLDVNMAGGRIQVDGFADIRNPSSILIDVKPTISNLPFELAATTMGVADPAIIGPLAASGRIHSRIETSVNFLESLNGTIAAAVGQGHLTQVGPIGRILLKILTIADIRAYFSRSLLENLTSKGIPFKEMRSDISVKDGIMHIESFSFESSALNARAQGKIALLDQELEVDVNLEPLGTLDKLLGKVPIAGNTGKSLTKIYTKVEGSIGNPKIRVKPVKGVTEGVKEATKASGEVVKKAIQAPGKTIKGVIDFLRKGKK